MAKAFFFTGPIILTLIFILFAPIFMVKNIWLSENQDCLKKEKVQEQINHSQTNIFLINGEKLAETLKEKYPCIKNIEVQKKFFTTLKVTLEVSQPLVKIANSNLFLTGEGLVVEANIKDKPTFYLPGNSQVILGNKVEDESLLKVLEITAGLIKSDFTAQDLRILDKDSFAAFSQQENVVIFSLKKDAITQVDSLQLVLSKAKIDGTKIAKIDLRFDKPVIVYK